MKEQKSFQNKQKFQWNVGDTGNFLNLPYYNNTKGLRYAIHDNGDALTLEQFYTAYDKYSCTRGDVEGIRVAEKKKMNPSPWDRPV